MPTIKEPVQTNAKAEKPVLAEEVPKEESNAQIPTDIPSDSTPDGKDTRCNCGKLVDISGVLQRQQQLAALMDIAFSLQEIALFLRRMCSINMSTLIRILLCVLIVKMIVL